MRLVPSEVFADEVVADRRALREADFHSVPVFVVQVEGGFRLSPSPEAGAVTKWTAFGSVSLRQLSPLVVIG